MLRLPTSLLAVVISGLASLAITATAQNQMPASATPILLAKFNFEDIPAHVPNWGAGNNGKYKPATGWKEPFAVKLDSVDPHSGLNSLRFELLQNRDENATGNGERIVHSPSIQVPELVADGASRVAVHFSVRTQGVYEGAVGIRILERSEKQTSLGLVGDKETLLEIPQTEKWVELSAEGKLRSGTRSITFMVVMEGRQQAPATVWIDDISLEFLPAAR